MPEEPDRFQSENLPKFRWATFFEELLETYKGKPVNILSGGDFLSSEPPIDTAPLTDIDYDSKYSGLIKHKGRLVITSGGAQGERVTIDVPTIVWVFRDYDNVPLGIEVINEENNRVVVRFA